MVEIIGHPFFPPTPTGFCDGKEKSHLQSGDITVYLAALLHVFSPNPLGIGPPVRIFDHSQLGSWIRRSNSTDSSLDASCSYPRSPPQTFLLRLLLLRLGVMESYGASETKVFLISERAADAGIALLLHSLLFSLLFFYPGAIREHQSPLPSAHTFRMGMGASVLSLQAAGLSAYSSSSNPFL